MLGDEWTAVDADDIVMRECLVKLFFGPNVVVWIAVCGHQNSLVYD